MKSLIQRFPAALLPLLSIKASDTPPLMDDTVAPSLDMSPFYLTDRLEVQSASALGISSVTGASIVVPAGEYWWLFSAAATANNITAGSSLKLSIGIGDTAGLQCALNAMGAIVASVAGETFIVAANAPVPILLRPGFSILASTLVDPGAGTLDLYCRALVARLTPN